MTSLQSLSQEATSQSPTLLGTVSPPSPKMQAVQQVEHCKEESLVKNRVPRPSPLQSNPASDHVTERVPYWASISHRLSLESRLCSQEIQHSYERILTEMIFINRELYKSSDQTLRIVLTSIA